MRPCHLPHDWVAGVPGQPASVALVLGHEDVTLIAPVRSPAANKRVPLLISYILDQYLNNIPDCP